MTQGERAVEARLIHDIGVTGVYRQRVHFCCVGFKFDD